MMALAIVLALIIGVTLGLLGGGGAILTLPMLVYVVGLDAREAIAGSLFVVGITSVVGVVSHARAGRVSFRVGGLFGIAGMAGAYLGGRLAHYLPATLLLVLFAGMMVLTSVAMLRGRRAGPEEPREPAVAKALLLGAAVGMLSGLVGAGGGFLVVPALALLGGLPMPRAIATSLLVISMQSAAGFAGHVATTTLHFGVLLWIAGAAVAGSLVGARLAKYANPETLRKSFGWLVLGMGVFLFGKQLPDSPLRTFGLPAALVVVLALAIFFITKDARARRSAVRRAAPLAGATAAAVQASSQAPSR
jgi:uncharacterized membrane protein YfcA